MTLRRIDHVTRLTNSLMGNPRFRATFDDGSSALTQTDSSVSYVVENLARSRDLVRVSFSRTGQISSMVRADS